MPLGVIPFFTDQNVPDSLGDEIISAGHQLTRLRDVMVTTTADPVIAVACSGNGQVLVSHDGDFRATSRRLKLTQREYQSNLHRINMRCPEPYSALRFRSALKLIEFEWALIQPGYPMVIEIHMTHVRVMR